jgi:hypothetical protein
MRSVSKLIRRAVPSLLLIAVLSQSAYARAIDDPHGPRGFWKTVKHFVVKVLDQFSVPPG